MSCFQTIQARKMCFTIFQNKKTSFQPIRKRSSKSRKIEIFPKGLTHGFSQKWSFFHLFFLGNIGQENVFYNILERKNAFQPIKTRRSNSRKVEIFPKGLTHGFGQKGHMLFLKSGKKLNFCKGLDRLIISKNKEWKNFKFFNKSVDQPFWKNLIFSLF